VGRGGWLVSLGLQITWDPGIRGILVVLVSVAVLCGSVYLVLATNTGARLGFLVAGAALFGWITLMGMVWWLFGIGYIGSAPAWEVVEVVTSESPEDLRAAATEDVRDLPDGWREIPEGDPARGEAEATAAGALAGDSPVALFESSSDFVVVDAWEKGGKDPDSLISELPLPHPVHHAVIQVQQAVEPPPVPFGTPPPPAEPDPDAPVQSVVLVRDLGDKRLPPALITITSGIIFAIFCNVLHRRDRQVAAARAQVGAGRSSS
jgi:hypothetical protein